MDESTNMIKEILKFIQSQSKKNTIDQFIDDFEICDPSFNQIVASFCETIEEKSIYFDGRKYFDCIFEKKVLKVTTDQIIDTNTSVFDLNKQYINNDKEIKRLFDLYHRQQKDIREYIDPSPSAIWKYLPEIPKFY